MNGSFGWGNRGKCCYWKDDEEFVIDRYKNGGLMIILVEMNDLLVIFGNDRVIIVK